MRQQPQLITAGDELSGFADLLNSILTSGRRNGVYHELLGCLFSIDFHQSGWREFCNFREIYLEATGDLARTGWERATRVYTNRADRPTKPSYLGRLVAFPDVPRKPLSGGKSLNQIDKISIELAKKPGLSNLSFVILRPADLYDQFRPGYVPCAIAGDFKLREKRLDLNVMFRTSDALFVGYADIYYVRRLQMQILDGARLFNDSLKDAEIGLLNMYLCRTYIQRTGRTKKGVRIDGLKSARAVIHLIASR
jgi:hypothetical protein